MSRTYYDILGLKSDANQDQIKRAYRKMAMQAHPDINKSKEATNSFVEISEAYAILSDANKRMVYNQSLRDRAAMEAGKAYSHNRQAHQNGQKNQAGQASGKPYTEDEAFQRWVYQAKMRAKAQANMNYQDFKNSKFAQTEASVFFYLQYAVMGTMFLIGLLLLALPFVMMFFINWKAVFLGLLLGPFAFKIFAEGRRGLKELRQSL